MSAVKWNPQQQSAIDCENPELLISAAAGSGKTAVLVERILRKIVENPEITIDNFLVVTFTHTAAGELKEHLYKKLTEVMLPAARTGKTSAAPNCHAVQSCHWNHALLLSAAFAGASCASGSDAACQYSPALPVPSRPSSCRRRWRRY